MDFDNPERLGLFQTVQSATCFIRQKISTLDYGIRMQNNALMTGGGLAKSLVSLLSQRI